ncbi:MAG: hypothetical protein NTX03_14685 [Bacteroidetes bacterium]|nr:hypothetical protein [Bacteroidota bacterium]
MGRFQCIIILLIFVATTACNNQPAPKKPLTELEEIKAAVNGWSRNLRERKFDSAAKYYQPKVNYFGKWTTAKEVMEKEKIPFINNVEYVQFVSDIEAKKISPQGTRVHFKKQSVNKGMIDIHFMYFVLCKNQNQQWQIAMQGDSTADKLTHERNYHRISLRQINSCEKAAEAIFLSSKIVKDRLDDDDAHYKLEYTPEYKKNPDGNYWFWVYVSPANSEMPHTIGRFEVNPKTGQLYEYNEVDEKPNPIDFDKKLLKVLGRFCGGVKPSIKKIKVH